MEKTILKIGMWSGGTAFVAALGFCIAQFFIVFGTLHFPWDGILIFGFSLGIVIPFMLVMLVVHHITPNGKKFWSQAALSFTIVYAVYVTMNYVVQLATVIPAALQSTLQDIRVLDQTPHSLFWDLDGLGYIFMGIACLFAIPAFEKVGVQKWIRILLLANALTTPVIAFIYFYPNFSPMLTLLGLPWAVAVPGAMLLLAILFRKKLKADHTTVSAKIHPKVKLSEALEYQ